MVGSLWLCMGMLAVVTMNQTPRYGVLVGPSAGVVSSASFTLCVASVADMCGKQQGGKVTLPFPEMLNAEPIEPVTSIWLNLPSPNSGRLPLSSALNLRIVRRRPGYADLTRSGAV